MKCKVCARTDVQVANMFYKYKDGYICGECLNTLVDLHPDEFKQVAYKNIVINGCQADDFKEEDNLENLLVAPSSAPIDPKQSQAIKKVTFNNVPITLDIVATFGADDGARKYGPWNWLQLEEGTMSLMTYINALKRHWILFRAGQDKTSDGNVHHLDSLIAGLAVVRDAMIFGKVNDDRIKLSEEQLVILEKHLNKELPE